MDKQNAPMDSMDAFAYGKITRLMLYDHFFIPSQTVFANNLQNITAIR